MSTNTWAIDPAHSDVSFSIRHLGISNVRGSFTGVTGTGTFDAERPNGEFQLSVTIDTNTFTTGNEGRDTHVKSPDFLDVAQYPTITFEGKGVETKQPGQHQVIGDLTLHGVTKEVRLDVEGPSGEVTDAYGSTRVGAVAKTTINRKDFGLAFHAVLEGGSILIGDHVNVTLEVQFIKQAAA